jgi:hypothetical protein
MGCAKIERVKENQKEGTKKSESYLFHFSLDTSSMLPHQSLQVKYYQGKLYPHKTRCRLSVM